MSTTSSRNMVSEKVAKNVLAYVDGGDLAVVKVICEAFCDMILNEVKEGREVSLTNFLKFKRVTRPPRTFNIPPKKGTKAASESDQEGSEDSKGERAFKSARYAMQVSIMAHTKQTFEAIPIVEASKEQVVKAKGSKKATSLDEEAESSVPSDEPKSAEIAKKPAAKKVTAKKEETVKKSAKKAAKKKVEIEEEEEEEVEEEPEVEPPKKKTAKESPNKSSKKTNSYSASDIESDIE